MDDEVRKYVKGKEQAYRICLNNEAAKTVLADLRLFCNGTRTNFSSDALQMARMEGRREVFMRIMTFLKVDYEDIYNFTEE